jgi:hypothetical protein
MLKSILWFGIVFVAFVIREPQLGYPKQVKVHNGIHLKY